MKRQEVIDVLRELTGREPSGQTINGWYTTQCPLAEWTHPGRRDRHPSFGVLLQEDRESIFNCFTCGEKGRLSWLVRRYARFSGEDFSHLLDDVELDEVIGGELPDLQDYPTKKIEKLADPMPDDYFYVYDSAAGHPYLEERGIDEHTARTLKLLVDPDDQGVERIMFPVFDHLGGLQGFTGRATNNRSVPRIRDYFGLPKRLLLLGSHDVDSRWKYVALVEGLFDYARLRQLGLPVVCSLHAGLTSNQAKILKLIDRPVVVMYDDDEAGRKGRAEVAKAVNLYLSLWKVRYPKGKSDPGELTRREVDKMLNERRLL